LDWLAELIYSDVLSLWNEPVILPRIYLKAVVIHGRFFFLGDHIEAVIDRRYILL